MKKLSTFQSESTFLNRVQVLHVEMTQDIISCENKTEMSLVGAPLQTEKAVFWIMLQVFLQIPFFFELMHTFR